VVNGDFIAFASIFSPIFLGVMLCAAFNSAIPPPGTIPSCKAALTA
jgi:hypothetical protein